MSLSVPTIPDSANLTVSAPVSGGILAVSTSQAAIDVTPLAGLNVVLQAIGADVDVAPSSNDSVVASAIVTTPTAVGTRYVPVRIASGSAMSMAIPVPVGTRGRVWLHAVTPSGSGTLRILRM